MSDVNGIDDKNIMDKLKNIIPLSTFEERMNIIGIIAEETQKSYMQGYNKGEADGKNQDLQAAYQGIYR